MPGEGATLAELTAKVERVSAGYAERCNIRRDDDWFALKLQEEVGELVAEHLRNSGRGRQRDTANADALADEAADVLGQLLTFALHNDIDLEAALERKWFKYLEPGA
jgi:NTP pyrophosphatase (non-canonical NTP hydrolase)